MNPQRIVLKGNAGEKIAGTATLIPAEKYRFKITEARLKEGKEVSVSWKAYKGDTGMGYLITITNLKKDEGQYRDQVILKTDSPILPEIPIAIYGNIS